MTAGSGPDMALGHTSPPVFELRNISKRFGGEQALISVDLEVRGGEVHGLLGPNGSGKSTLIKILSGYHAAEPGAELLIHGRSPRRHSAGSDSASCIRTLASSRRFRCWKTCAWTRSCQPAGG
jgi:ABC-type sugar transport system ATPase subunit